MKTTTPNPAWAFQTDYVERYAFQHGLFSPKECDMIIDFAKRYKLVDAEVHNDELVVNKDYRDSKLIFINPVDEINWAYQRISNCVKSLNDQFFKFDLWGFAEGLQFTEYNAPSGKYDRHIDRIWNGQVRKLSIVIQLTNETEYEGGDFEFIDCDTPEKLHRNQGTLLAFPSYSLHAVTPVTKGTRHSLVGWITGAPFK
jgi:PKHD-type hydroxylase